MSEFLIPAIFGLEDVGSSPASHGRKQFGDWCNGKHIQACFKVNMKNPYNEEFYKNHLKKREILHDYAEGLYQLYKPTSVVDVGCGPGFALEHFRKRGCKVLGLEYSAEAALKVAPENIRDFILEEDVTKWLDDWKYKKYDLAISWVMAEHVDVGYASDIVEGLTRLADTVHFAAGPPGQAGVNHVNLKPPEWWAKIFKKYGYVLDPVYTCRWFMPLEKKYGDNRYGKCIREFSRIYRKRV